MSAALFECVQMRTRLLQSKAIRRTAWFNVNVFPVPKGPNTTRGGALIKGTAIFLMISFWSSFKFGLRIQGRLFN